MSEIKKPLLLTLLKAVKNICESFSAGQLNEREISVKETEAEALLQVLRDADHNGQEDAIAEQLSGMVRPYLNRSAIADMLKVTVAAILQDD